MKNAKKYLLFAAVCVAVLCFAGCGRGANSNVDETTGVQTETVTSSQVNETAVEKNTNNNINEESSYNNNNVNDATNGRNSTNGNVIDDIEDGIEDVGDDVSRAIDGNSR